MFKNKKLLILGGHNVHSKVVKAAKEMGVETIVIDNLEPSESPAKQIANDNYLIDIYDVDSMVELCKKKKIDGVLSLFLDLAQRPYYEVCHRLGLPCYIDNWNQVFALTDKDAFKKACIEAGVDVIPTYDEKALNDDDYPVLVKPAHSRGSRGQTICNSGSELSKALAIAKNESDNNEAIIEKYMGNKNDFTMTYFCVDGTPYLMRTADRLLGRIEDGLEKVAMAELTPSKFDGLYVEKIDSKIKRLIKQLGIKNGPVFMQGFIDGDKLRVYDPGFRFPGTEFDLLFINNMKIDLIKKMIFFALEGYVPEEYGNVNDDMHLFNNKVGLELWPCVREGTIKRIDGFENLKMLPEVLCYTMRHKIGERIKEYRNVNQRLAEIDILCDDTQTLKKTVKGIYDSISCVGENGEELIFSKLNVEEIS